MTAGRHPGRQVIPRPSGARAGGGPPWRLTAPVGLQVVRAVFDAAGPPGAPDPAVPEGGAPAGLPAAVLVPLFEEGGDARVILTRRSSNLRSHTGEVAFPGGRLEPDEEAVAGALREAGEEVGLDPADCEVLGQLPPLSTLSSRSAITPFVAALAARPELRPNPHEVERVFDVALTELASPGVYHEERWPVPGMGERSVHFFELDGDTVWGATARILHHLLDLVDGGDPGRLVEGI